jgi:hypothetical protein
MTLFELQASAVRIGEELHRAKYNGGVAPTHEELTEFLVEVEQVEPDDCARCDDAGKAVETFDLLVKGNHPRQACCEGLALILDEASNMDQDEARALVAAFVELIEKDVRP